MTLTNAQLAALKTWLDANAAGLNDEDAAALLNAAASPDFWVWRTSVSRSSVYNDTSPDATTWNWTTYKNQSATEQNAWTQIFMGDTANFAQANVRAGVAAIFTGSAQANAQRNHCLAVGRRKATAGEKLFAAGTGSAASPATMAAEGVVTAANVSEARNL